jgi:Ni/Co efflux regulator RcnB
MTYVFDPEIELARFREDLAKMKEALALLRLRQLAAKARAFNLAYMDANPERFMSIDDKRATIIAMTPLEFREWTKGKHRSTYTRERQWRTDDRNARKLAAREAGEPWTGNDPRTDDA